MQHRQVVLLICGLMSDPTPIIHLVYELWIQNGQNSEGKTLIEAMFLEKGLKVPKDLLHNEWINYYNHNQGLIKEITSVYVPSRKYQFDNMKANLSCNIQHGKSETPECSMSITDPHVSVTKNISSICYRIWQLQAVRDLYLYNVKCEDLPDPHVITISKNTESLRINNCKLPMETLSLMIQQIKGCLALRVLDLSENTLTGCLCSFLPDPHPGLLELNYLHLRATELNTVDVHRLLCIAQKLPNLQVLDLSYNTLTGYLPSFLPDPDPGLPQLKHIHLRSTSLNIEDLQQLSHITESNKLPKLRELDLSENTLTGCLPHFLPDPHPGLPELRWLHLKSTSLNKDDLQHLLSVAYKLPKLQELDLSGYTLTGCLSSFLRYPHSGLLELKELNLGGTALNKDDLLHFSHITQSNKLPKLCVLDLSRTTLTGCLSRFLPDLHPGLPQLKKLKLSNTALNKNDLKHLKHLIQTQKLPGLKLRSLRGNSLSEMETDVEHPVDTCVTQYQTDLDLWINELSFIC